MRASPRLAFGCSCHGTQAARFVWVLLSMEIRPFREDLLPAGCLPVDPAWLRSTTAYLARRFSWSATECAAPVAAQWNVELREIHADTALALCQNLRRLRRFPTSSECARPRAQQHVHGRAPLKFPRPFSMRTLLRPRTGALHFGSGCAGLWRSARPRQGGFKRPDRSADSLVRSNLISSQERADTAVRAPSSKDLSANTPASSASGPGPFLLPSSWTTDLLESALAFVGRSEGASRYCPRTADGPRPQHV